MRKTAFWLLTFILTVGVVSAQQPATGVEILVNRDGVNVRLFPAIGAEVLGFVQAGWRAPATGRSPDDEWIRIDFNGEEGWIGVAVINIFGDINALPVADPRTIPFGGFESPRAGQTSATGAITGRLADSGMRVRSGPTRAYPVLANAPRYTVFPLLGRTANNAWLQVNYEGTLGWVNTPYVEIQNGASIIDLPINGIVADHAPLSDATATDFEATLRFLLDRVDLAQPSLDSMRGIWTGVALGEQVACGPFPARPTDYNIPNPLLAAYYPTLDPIQTLFNDAMGNLRLSVDLWMEACGRPVPAGSLVAVPTASAGLQAVNLTDQQFAELRARLNELLPPPFELGPDQCLFTYHSASEVLPIVGQGQLVRSTLDPTTPVVGFCFDAAAGQSLRFELLQVNGNATPRIAVSPFDNPTAFVASGLGTTGTASLSVGPVILNQTARYLLLISHDDPYLDAPLQSDFALLISDVTGRIVSRPGLYIDQESGQVSTQDPAVVPTLAPQPILPTPDIAALITCPSLGFTCDQLLTCEQAQACYTAGNFTLDSDGNGVPCENLCGGG